MVVVCQCGALTHAHVVYGGGVSVWCMGGGVTHVVYGGGVTHALHARGVTHALMHAH